MPFVLIAEKNTVGVNIGHPIVTNVEQRWNWRAEYMEELKICKWDGLLLLCLNAIVHCAEVMTYEKD